MLKLTRTKTLLSFAMAAAGFLLAMHWGIQFLNNQMLRNDAHTLGMEWAEHIERRLPKLGEGINPKNGHLILGAEEAKALAVFTEDVLSVGNVYQIDFINADCLCEITLGGHQPKTPHDHSSHEGSDSHNGFLEIFKQRSPMLREGHAKSDHSEHSHGSFHGRHHEQKVEKPTGKHVGHVFQGSGGHVSSAGMGLKSGQYPLNRKSARHVISKNSHDIYLHHEKVKGQPSSFAEVYHPVAIDGRVIYALRIMVNLENHAALYAKYSYLGASILLLLLFLSFGYPTAKLMQTSRNKRLADERAHYLAEHDVLTGIRNRNAFQQTAPQLLEQAENDQSGVLLFLVDVDNFKEINDFYGHHIGDLVLQKVAQTLLEKAPSDALVARIGGDEFAVIAPLNGHKDASANRVFDIPSMIEVHENDQKIVATFCVGIARHPRDGTGLKELMQHADLALYTAKEQTLNKVQEYHESLGSNFLWRANLIKEFRQAILDGQIVPYFQPLISSLTGKMVGFESLARWVHPTKGVLTPSTFDVVFEDQEITHMLGSAMLQQVTSIMGKWKAEGFDFGGVGINVGEGDLARSGFALDVATQLAKNNVPSRQLTIEVTEHCAFGGNKEVSLQTLNELENLGCHIALDDFGTGYSSITHIKELPFRAVKIDKSFVRRMVDSRVDKSIIQALLAMGKSIGFKLVAEGVEEAEQVEALRDLGCDMLQGYYFSEPVPAEQIRDLMERHNQACDGQIDTIAA